MTVEMSISTVPQMFDLAAASAAVDAALQTARARGLPPMTVVALDAGGHVIAAKREDRSGIVRFEVAFGKAWGSLGMGKPSNSYGAPSTRRAVSHLAVVGASQGRFVPVPGGVLVLNRGGDVIGAMGASGAASDADEACLVEGIKAAGLISNPQHKE